MVDRGKSVILDDTISYCMILKREKCHNRWESVILDDVK